MDRFNDTSDKVNITVSADQIHLIFDASDGANHDGTGFVLHYQGTMQYVSHENSNRILFWGTCCIKDDYNVKSVFLMTFII